MRALPCLIALLSLGGCVSIENDDPPARERGADHACHAETAQRFVGAKADRDAGSTIQRETGAAVLQWIPPDTVVTLEFRADRVRVGYDRSMTIIGIRCG